MPDPWPLLCRRQQEGEGIRLMVKNCYICGGDKFVDGHHVDCQEGELSPEKEPLCRRCHRTFHDLGVDWFDDEFLDKAIELENRRREIVYSSLVNPVKPLELLKRENINRSSYFNKTHGIKVAKGTVDNKGTMTPVFSFHLPHGEPLCGWDWVHAHLYDLMDWVPRIEVIISGIPLLSTDIYNAKELKETVKALGGLRTL